MITCFCIELNGLYGIYVDDGLPVCIVNGMAWLWC